MKRRYGVLALALPALLLLRPVWQNESTTEAGGKQLNIAPQQPTPVQTATGMATLTPATPGSVAIAANQGQAQARSWQTLPEEAESQLAGEIQQSNQPLDERLDNLRNVEGQWLSEGESLTLLQGRYAQALEQLSNESEQLTLAERLAALTRLQDEWTEQHPDLAADLFNPDARLLQARQLWGDAELETLARHFLPAPQVEASLAFAGQRQQQLDQRSRYQQQLAELEQQLLASQNAMAPERWQQHREAVLSQWRRDFFAQEQGQP
ncbi:hypothetical protein [Aeromonas tecta]|uniref:hypothetical protein n=1 Tax=Aeromonas tecta TaxID=324617 RepID=UPI000681DA3E|nr:hypothetical protein [Aeromonas tecta]